MKGTSCFSTMLRLCRTFTVVTVDSVSIDCSFAHADLKVVYETPLRVFTALPQNTSVEFCDYLFPDETLVDSANRFRDLVGIEVDEGSIDESAEHVPSKLWSLFIAVCSHSSADDLIAIFTVYLVV